MNCGDPFITKFIIGFVVVITCVFVFKLIQWIMRGKDTKKELIRQARIQRESIGRRVKK